MKTRKITDCCKNAIGTVFLLGGAFLTCSTLMSMRSVWADPIAPMNDMFYGPQANRAGTPARSGRASPRNNATANTVNRTTANAKTPSRSVASRNVVSRSNTRGNVSNASRATVARNVVSRTATRTVTPQTVSASNRAVRGRDATNVARVSHQGSAIRGSKAIATSNTYTYLSNKLYTGNYSNIIDPTTGLISADAYSNCMESYYTCMDEICTARNAAQRRCACAGRVKAFAEAEAALETANEELIKVSGELALLIANKGKDVSQAFMLTDAEKVMNCVSWQDAYKDGSWTTGSVDSDAYKWCTSHGIYEGAETCAKPKYCESSGNNFGFDIDNIDGNSSDILASLQAWADAKEQTITILTDDRDKLTDAFSTLTDIVGGLSGIGGTIANLGTDDAIKDSLAETWGYELFEYAHNNVCNRVLDSCFNGIYEACGRPNNTYCGNGQSQCPYNYNSVISVTSNNTGEYTLNFITPNSNYTLSNSATCFGYTSASGDPYYSLRKPVADARRSIMQKYALDANADCDAYGEQLRATAQNIGYQKVAAQQALQQKRLEFYNEEVETILSKAVTAGTNFNECLSEIYDCYEEVSSSNENWPTARIKTYCAQISNVPHCYEEMICNPSMAQFKAVIDEPDNTECLNTQDYTTNTCRNIVTLNEILNGTGATSDMVAVIKTSIETGTLYGDKSKVNSAALREQCMQDSWIQDIRDWKRPADREEEKNNQEQQQPSQNGQQQPSQNEQQPDQGTEQ